MASPNTIAMNSARPKLNPVLRDQVPAGYRGRKLRRKAMLKVMPDVYEGRLLAARLETLDDALKVQGIDIAQSEEMQTLREGYIKRARDRALASYR